MLKSLQVHGRGLGAMLVLAGMTLLLSEDAFGYGYLTYGTGRDSYANRYAIPADDRWPVNDSTGGAAGLTYDFGKFEITALPGGVTNAMITQAIQAAETAWEPWVNVSIDSTGTIAGGSNTGFLRIDTAAGSGAYALPYGWNGGAQTYGTIVFQTTAGGGSAWTQQSLSWTMIHEFGHILGLRDMYDDFAGAPLAEDFVDHAVAGNANPQREASSLRDNVMYQYNYAGNNYTQAPQTIIDNDEIAGVTWLWGGPQNQIVTGDLKDRGNADRVIDIDFHHGDQAGNSLGWWDYRVSFKAGGGGKPYVDLEFPGYEQHIANFYGDGAPTITHTDLGNDIHRFELSDAGWVGNLELWVKSQYSDERRVRAWVQGGGQTDNFVLPVKVQGLAHDGGSNWAVVFGPQAPITSSAMDYGDLPDSYKTTLAADGPRYLIKGVTLGYEWDDEFDGQPTPYADGDDMNLWGDFDPQVDKDDEDGVTLAGQGGSAFMLNQLGADANFHLDAWFDINRNGMFEHATEHFIDDILFLLDGSALTYDFDDLGFLTSDFNSRWRVTVIDDPSDQGFGVGFNTDVLPYGVFGSPRGSIGEVEDYYGIPEPASLALVGLGAMAMLRRRA